MEIIFEEPITSFLVGGVLLGVEFVFQLFLCNKARKTSVKLIPSYGFLLLVGITLLTYLGAFGTGDGFLGNVNMLVAGILAIISLFALAGIVAAWIVYYCQLKRRR